MPYFLFLELFGIMSTDNYTSGSRNKSTATCGRALQRHDSPQQSCSFKLMNLFYLSVIKTDVTL
jgi:hypothetical protein